MTPMRPQGLSDVPTWEHILSQESTYSVLTLNSKDLNHEKDFSLYNRNHFRSIGDNMKTIITNDRDLQIITQYAKSYIDPPERKRIGCRAIIIKDNKVLLSWEERKNVYMSPGGGVEEGESLEECVIRELSEEAGFKVVKRYREFSCGQPKEDTQRAYYVIRREYNG